MDWMGDWTRTWRDVLSLCFQDNIYGQNKIESILKEEFGEDTLMFGEAEENYSRGLPQMMKVAVTTTETITSTGCIFTNYNKSSHTIEGSYRWSQRDHAYPKLTVWEAYVPRL